MSNGKSNTKSIVVWTTSEFEKLVALIKPHPLLYNVQESSRKNILARESTWEQIAGELSKPVEECKKRWRALRDGYMKTARLGTLNKPKIGLFKNLDFLNEVEATEDPEEEEEQEEQVVEIKQDEEVITDNQEYYEITIADNPQKEETNYIPNLLMPRIQTEEPSKKIRKGGRKRNLPAPVGLQPIKILPKPVTLVNQLNGPKLYQYIEEPKVVPQAPQPQRSEVLDSLIEKVLKEHTNEIDVFFRSMAASVKKLQPNLIPKVKMEVCNVIAKYEMQSFDKNSNSF